jgi:transposase-like protein
VKGVAGRRRAPTRCHSKCSSAGRHRPGGETGHGRRPARAQRVPHDPSNGRRSRLLLSTEAGDVELAIPMLRHRRFFPALLDPRPSRPPPTISLDPVAVIMEAIVPGVCTRGVDDLVGALGIDR